MAKPSRELPAPPASNGATSRYRRAVTICARQPYYNLRADGACADLAIAPAAGTAERLSRQAILWRPSGDGGDLLAPAGALAALAAGPPLLFIVEIVRPAFAAVTDLPSGFGCGALTLCLSNRRNPGRPGEDERIAPDWTRSIGVEAALERADSLRRNEPAPPASAIHGWAGSGEGAPFLDEAARQVAATGPRRLPFALLQLHIPAPAPAPAPAPGAEAGAAPLRFALEFQPLRTRWRYVVATRGGGVDPATLAVRDSAEKPILFKPDSSAVGPLPGARSTSAFLSAEPIALAQRPPRSFYLEGKRAAGRTSRLIDPLPGPALDSLVHRGGGGDAAAAVSEIYVYL